MPRGRPREFDKRDALERAMQLFWEQGYERTGVSDLLREMGISRQSLYDTFGSKRDLFVQSLEHYRDAHLGPALDLLGRPGPELEKIEALVRFFERLAGADRGCLVANAITEIAPHDEPIATMLQEILELLETSLRLALERAQARGELAAEKSPRQLARALVSAVIGLTVTGKLSPGPAALRDASAGALAMLD